MVGQIVFSASSVAQLDELAQTLYDKKYFSFLIDIDVYINEIYEIINLKITGPTIRKSPAKFQKQGEKYLKYKMNSHTTWYIFFDPKGDRFLINFIINNHSQEHPELLYRCAAPKFLSELHEKNFCHFYSSRS